MFTKRKKVGGVRRVQDIHVTKKVIDWEAVLGAVCFGILVLAVLANMGG